MVSKVDATASDVRCVEGEFYYVVKSGKEYILIQFPDEAQDEVMEAVHTGRRLEITVSCSAPPLDALNNLEITNVFNY
jgi:hypothetical protein